MSIVAANVNVDVFGPLTEDTPSPHVASIVAGQRIDGIFTGVGTLGAWIQWQLDIALLCSRPSGLQAPMEPRLSRPTRTNAAHFSSSRITEYELFSQLVAGAKP